MSIFDKRVAFKPFEYPEVVKFQEAIQHSYWLVSEWNFIADVDDFHTRLTPTRREIIKRCILAISQIEVSVKRFWGHIGDRFPKAELEFVGAVFGESEVRHANAYSHLLEVLGFNKEFECLLDNPIIQGRVDYLTKYLKGAADNANENYTLTLALFSMFIENVSLFSQFLIIKSFNKFENCLRDVDNVVDATSKEETIHALFGAWLVNQIKREFPVWFDAEFYEKLYRACKKAYDAEMKIVDWIFEPGELPFLTRAMVDEFIKNRFNESLALVGGKPVFEVDKEILNHTLWFAEETVGDVSVDFFHKKSVAYSRNQQSFTEGDLF